LILFLCLLLVFEFAVFTYGSDFLSVCDYLRHLNYKKKGNFEKDKVTTLYYSKILCELLNEFSAVGNLLGESKNKLCMSYWYFPVPFILIVHKVLKIDTTKYPSCFLCFNLLKWMFCLSGILTRIRILTIMSYLTISGSGLGLVIVSIVKTAKEMIIFLTALPKYNVGLILNQYNYLGQLFECSSSSPDFCDDKSFRESGHNCLCNFSYDAIRNNLDVSSRAQACSINA